MYKIIVIFDMVRIQMYMDPEPETDLQRKKDGQLRIYHSGVRVKFN